MRGSVGSLRLVAVAITAVISATYLVLPVYETNAGRETVVESNGWWVIVLLLLPIVIVLLPYRASDGNRRATERWAATLLTIFALVTGFTIGTPYLLPALLLWTAWGLSRRNPHASQDPVRSDDGRGLAGGSGERSST